MNSKSENIRLHSMLEENNAFNVGLMSQDNESRPSKQDMWSFLTSPYLKIKAD